jgi:hypothetical protein
MFRTTKLLIAAAVLCFPLVAQAKAPSSATDLAYCAKLSNLYLRYVGPDPNSRDFAGVTPDVDGGVAVAKCREGDAATAIPILQRKLSDAGFTLPPRG